MRPNFLSVVGFGLLAIGLLSGCVSPDMKPDASTAPAAGLLEPINALRFNDVVVPAGFKMMPQGSYSFESAGIRVGVLRYQGKANPDQVVNFYKEQMPMYNWTLLNIVEYGDRLINFDRENESCIISLLSKGSNVIITISLGPKAQRVLKKAKEPIK